MKVEESFRPLLLSRILIDTMAEIALHKKDRDDAQKGRIETALKILSEKSVPLPAYPIKTKQSLLDQMNKQMTKINRKK